MRSLVAQFSNVRHEFWLNLKDVNQLTQPCNLTQRLLFGLLFQISSHHIISSDAMFDGTWQNSK